MQKHTEFSPTKKLYETLVECIESGKENPCRDAVLPFFDYLAQMHGMKIESVLCEYAADDADRADIILVCIPSLIPDDIDPATAIGYKKCIIYECKKPSARVLDRKDKSAKRPNRSAAWIEAEDQLAYYSDIVRNNNNIMKHVKGILPVIEKGGIIIGRHGTGEEWFEFYHRYKNAAPHNVFTWDDVLADIKNYFSREIESDT